MTKFQVGTKHTSQVMDCQVHTIGKAIRSHFEDPVRNVVLGLCWTKLKYTLAAFVNMCMFTITHQLRHLHCAYILEVGMVYRNAFLLENVSVSS